jgi:hypothetical protein
MDRMDENISCKGVFSLYIDSYNSFANASNEAT